MLTFVLHDSGRAMQSIRESDSKGLKLFQLIFRKKKNAQEKCPRGLSKDSSDANQVKTEGHSHPVEQHLAQRSVSMTVQLKDCCADF